MFAIVAIKQCSEKYISEHKSTLTFWEQIENIFNPVTKEDILKRYKGDPQFEAKISSCERFGLRIYERKILFQGDEYIVPHEVFTITNRVRSFTFFFSAKCSVTIDYPRAFPLIPERDKYLAKPYIYTQNMSRTDPIQGIKFKAIERITEMCVMIQTKNPIKKQKAKRHRI